MEDNQEQDLDQDFMDNEGEENRTCPQVNKAQVLLKYKAGTCTWSAWGNSG